MEMRTGTQAITRAISLLKIIAQQGTQGIRLVDLVNQIDLPQPTIHRILKSLVSDNMVTQEADSRCYRLGPLAFELGLVAAQSFNLNELSKPALLELAQMTGDTTFLFVRSGNDAVCVERVQGTYPIQTPALPIGSRQPLGVSAGGLALLAWLTPAETERILKVITPQLAEYGDLHVEELRQLLQLAQRQGYAYIANKAVTGISAIGLPVKNQTGAVVAAVAVAATYTRMTPDRIHEILSFLQQAAGRISRLLTQ